jgi:hypothetical protein
MLLMENGRFHCWLALSQAVFHPSDPLLAEDPQSAIVPVVTPGQPHLK